MALLAIRCRRIFYEAVRRQKCVGFRRARQRLQRRTGRYCRPAFQRRRSLPNDARIRLGHRAAMNVVPYQLTPALQALNQPRSRILIADGASFKGNVDMEG